MCVCVCVCVHTCTFVFALDTLLICYCMYVLTQKSQCRHIQMQCRSVFLTHTVCHALHPDETDSDYEPGDDNLPNLDPPVLNRQDSGTSQQPPLLQRQPQLPRTEHRSETSRPPPILRKQVERGREGAGGPPVLHRESEERVTLEISLPPLLPREGGERDGPEGRRKTKRGLTAAGWLLYGSDLLVC